MAGVVELRIALREDLLEAGSWQGREERVVEVAQVSGGGRAAVRVDEHDRLALTQVGDGAAGHGNGRDRIHSVRRPDPLRRVAVEERDVRSVRQDPWRGGGA